MNPKNQLPTLRSPALQYAIAIAFATSLGATTSTTHAQCYLDPTTGRQICPINRDSGSAQAYSPASNALVTIDSSAHCRIHVSDGTTGSGTLIHKHDSQAIVLTCSHLFDSSTQQIIVTFPNGERFAARLLDRDCAHDLAALAIRLPQCAALQVETADAVGTLTACGYGPNGQFRATSGRAIGSATPVGAKYPSLTMNAAVRPGDSGGAVLNTAGRLVGVVWGERDGCTYATCGRPVREFVAGIRGGQQAVEAAKPQSQPQSPNLDWTNWSREIEARIAALDAKKQDRGDFVQRAELAAYVRVDAVPQVDTTQLAKRSDVESNFQAIRTRFENIHTRIESVHQRVEKIANTKNNFLHGLSIAKLLAGTLGLSAPVAVAVVIAGRLIGKRTANRIRYAKATPIQNATEAKTTEMIPTPVVVDSPIPPQRTVPETHYVPIEKDSFAKAHQWASEHVARKYPGATEILQAQDSLIKQFIAGGT